MKIHRTIAAEQDKSWQVEILNNDPHYSKVYSTEGCVIHICKDGKGIIVTAKDPCYHQGILRQTIQIKQNEKGIVREKTRYSYDDGKVLSALGRHDGYDIFYVKYREKAKKLPESVKKMFFGYYGFGELPSSC